MYNISLLGGNHTYRYLYIGMMNVVIVFAAELLLLLLLAAVPHRLSFTF